jgi:hypothetical protein
MSVKLALDGNCNSGTLVLLQCVQASKPLVNKETYCSVFTFLIASATDNLEIAPQTLIYTVSVN